MWTILRYQYISCSKNIFLHYFFCKNKLSLLVSAVVIAVAIVLGTCIAFIIIYESVNVDGFLVPVCLVFLKHFLRLFSTSGFVFLSEFFPRAYLGFSKKSQWEHWFKPVFLFHLVFIPSILYCR